MKCLECGNESVGKYCSDKCGNAYRVKRHRNKNEEKKAVEIEEEVEVKEEKQEVVESLAEDHPDRNTLKDPNPDWCYERFPNINSSNKMMVCGICGKLSLTHRKMCTLEATNYQYNDCYQTK